MEKTTPLPQRWSACPQLSPNQDCRAAAPPAARPAGRSDHGAAERSSEERGRQREDAGCRGRGVSV